ncbi:tetratricopeptide repeat protein [Photobacterium leiognathi]|uniref:tetratricopeptide repeat protein n=1 Tax=Photobacterium leiognathi TaxID=553611 RepID=UPI000A494B85|nr:tetratricopeptide repeat protein [Photobacterium leiognathi]
MSELFESLSITESQLKFLFETLMAAQMCQLAMIVTNLYKSLLSEHEFKSKCGFVYQQLGDYEMTKTMLQESISLNENSPMVYCHLGFNYFYQGDSDLAAEQFQRSI